MYICYNGTYLPSGQPFLTPDNSSFKWGDGLFETLKVYEGKIIFEALHFERLLNSMRLLHYKTDIFPAEQLAQQVLELCTRNDLLASRVRISIFRETDGKAGYIIEAAPLPSGLNEWNTEGLIIDIHPLVRKSRDPFSNLKTANFLPYVLASLYATEHELDDVILLNTDQQVCDSSKANIFLVKNNEIFTPHLDSGCINGVMRRYLIDALQKLAYPVHQAAVYEKDLYEADEVFLTNAIQGIRWVRKFRDKGYSSRQSNSLFKEIFSTIYS